MAILLPMLSHGATLSPGMTVHLHRLHVFALSRLNLTDTDPYRRGRGSHRGKPHDDKSHNGKRSGGEL